MRWLRNQFRTFEAIFVWWRENLTVGGKTMTCMLLLTTPGLAFFNSALFLLFSAHLSFLFVVGVASYWFRPRLATRILAPAMVSAGELFELSVHVTNRSDLPACDLTLQLTDEPPSWRTLDSFRSVSSLKRGESIKIPMAMRATRRGLIALPNIRATSTFPLNLFSYWQRHFVEGELIVLPRYRRLTGLPGQSTMSHGTGERLQDLAMPGNGHDYFASREYLPGMPVRRWDYGSWARLGQPVIREFADTDQQTAAIVVDTCGVGGSSNGQVDPQLEATLSLAAAISDALTRGNQRIAFLALGDQLQQITPSHLWEQHDVIVRSLAVAAPATPSAFAELSAQLRELPPPTGVVYVLLKQWDAQRDKLCDDLRRRGAEVRSIFIGEPAAHTAGQPASAVLATIEEIEAGRLKI